MGVPVEISLTAQKIEKEKSLFFVIESLIIVKLIGNVSEKLNIETLVNETIFIVEMNGPENGSVVTGVCLKISNS